MQEKSHGWTILSDGVHFLVPSTVPGTQRELKRRNFFPRGLFISNCAGWSPFAPRSRPTLMDCSRDLVCPISFFGEAMGGAGGTRA